MERPLLAHGTVLGKPVYEIDLNPNDSTDDNFGSLFLQPLIQDYCQRHNLDRAEELKARIKDGKSRQFVSAIVVLFESRTGKLVLSLQDEATRLANKRTPEKLNSLNRLKRLPSQSA